VNTIVPALVPNAGSVKTDTAVNSATAVRLAELKIDRCKSFLHCQCVQIRDLTQADR
jgi:hypothetical protein